MCTASALPSSAHQFVSTHRSSSWLSWSVKAKGVLTLSKAHRKLAVSTRNPASWSISRHFRHASPRQADSSPLRQAPSPSEAGPVARPGAGEHRDRATRSRQSPWNPARRSSYAFKAHLPLQGHILHEDTSRDQLELLLKQRRPLIGVQSVA